MPQIAVRLTDDELRALDRLVAERHFASRAAAIRAALEGVRKEQEERELAEQYRRAYAEQPPTVEEIAWGEMGGAALAELTKDEPPWDFEDDDEAPPLASADVLHKVEVTAHYLLDLVQQQRTAS
jgi:Arc/MetJ-type ribon-helix-helix transcriptional regulator